MRDYPAGIRSAILDSTYPPEVNLYTEMPALILGGEYDPVTPPEWGRTVADTLDAGYFYLFPGTGHAVVTRGACPYGMMRAFLANPFTAPDGGCAAALGGPLF